MVEHNGKFRIPEYFVELLKYRAIPFREQKFLLALLHLQSMQIDWPRVRNLEVENRTYWADLKSLRDLGYAPRSNDARAFKASVSYWCGCEFFDELYLDQRSRNVIWKFSETVFDLMANMERYTLLDGQDIAYCRSGLDLIVYIGIAGKSGMRTPKFTVFDDWRNILKNGGYDQFHPLNPRKLDARLRPILQRWANKKKIEFVVGFLQDGTKPGYSEVEIRFLHEGSKWRKGQIFNAKKHKRQYLIIPTSGRPQQRSSKTAAFPEDDSI